MSIICLVNGAHEVRERSSEDVDVQPCGCASTSSRWLQMCRVHAELHQMLHVQARKDHDREAAIKELIS